MAINLRLPSPAPVGTTILHMAASLPAGDDGAHINYAIDIRLRAVNAAAPTLSTSRPAAAAAAQCKPEVAA